MKTKTLYDGPQKTFVVVFDPGEEVVEGLTRFAEENGIDGAEFSGIGALSDVELGFFEIDTKSYHRIPIDEQVEVVSFTGNFARKDGKAKLHPHIVVSKRDGTAHGGHLMTAHVRPTLEVVVTESPAYIRRRTDAATGLPLIDLSA
ncbi:DNA-binding protein [Acuticoccus sp. M5D2P5]|uniref:PPC domain-containing DNA-binding protein n=1 Tax=Acuticoccus kalidii TaxID=2910977 RepID=UPI001F478353|nr:PPC domain-containing DNA-binding protein [Acuticoccus kalidii]MCF3936696.1 DNA-binding protein [Acuticoccus kalidii]